LVQAIVGGGDVRSDRYLEGVPMTVYTITLTINEDAEALAKKIQFLWPKQVMAYVVKGPYEIKSFDTCQKDEHEPTYSLD
jgi:hypothetical protein